MNSTETPSSTTRRNLLNRLFMYLKKLPVSDAFLLKLFILAFCIFGMWYLISASTTAQVEVSSIGGSYTEGIVGTPRFVNPVLAVTRADKDMSALMYDGLMKLGENGTLIPNIADTITISEDGLTYNVVLRTDVIFHDGTPLTAEDVVFTVGRIQEPALSSPLRSNLEGVVVERLGDHELNFILPEPYAPFIENLTFGIIPKNIWKDASNEEFPFSQLNSEPVGSGPYKIERIVRNASGIPQSYILGPHAEYHLGSPKIETFTLKFFSNEEKLLSAFEEQEVDGFAGLGQEYLTNLEVEEVPHEIIQTPLPRTFAVFFNQNKSAALRDLAVREALDVAIDRDELINRVLNGYGRAITSPVPPGFGIETPSVETEMSKSRIDQAHEILKDGGWDVDEENGGWVKEIDDIETPLTFSISTVNNSVFEQTAEYLRSTWEELGVRVSVKQFEQSDLTQAIVRPRDYEALLLGTEVGRSLDFFSFWHSSQRNDPGLNVALYANITTDSILNEARTNTSLSDREAAVARFVEEVTSEVPAIFLYSPEFIYVFPNAVTGEVFNGLSEPSERFASVHTWHINTESVWPIFKTKDINE